MNIFLTGATGFVGRRLLEVLLRDPTNEVRCLVRDASRAPDHPRVRTVVGALPDALGLAADALSGCDVVVHLAALTGKARPADLENVNVRGTARLLELAARAGVSRFVHASTVAVRYPEKRHYPYARSKEEAEHVVRASDLDWAILRPTIVFGPGSPVGDSLRSLARAPVLPLFDGGRARIQPVHVDDVVAAFATLAGEAALGGRTIDFGGRDHTTFGEFLRDLRRELTGRDGPVLPIPLAPILPVLGFAERFAFDLLPVTAGQFYAFRHDGLAPDSPDDQPPRLARKGTADILGEFRTEVSAAPTAAERATRLDVECSAFTRYLVGVEPGDLIRAHYRRAHERGRNGPVEPDAPEDPLVDFARRGPGAVRLADTWAALFERKGVLRRKLVLLLAMLESSGDTAGRVDRPTVPTAPAFLFGAAARGVLFLLTLPVAALAVAWHRRGFRRPGAA